MCRPARISRGRSSRSWTQRVSAGEPASRSSSAPASRSASACSSAVASSTAPCGVEPDVAVRVDQAGQHPAAHASARRGAGSGGVEGDAAVDDPGLRHGRRRARRGPDRVRCSTVPSWPDPTEWHTGDAARRRWVRGARSAAEELLEALGQVGRVEAGRVDAVARRPAAPAPNAPPDAAAGAAFSAAARSSAARLAGLPRLATSCAAAACWLAALAGPAAMPGMPGIPGMPPPRGHLLHHLLRLAEPLEQLVDLGDRDARSPGRCGRGASR